MAENNQYRLFYAGTDYVLVEAGNDELIRAITQAGFYDYLGTKLPIALLTELPKAKSYTMTVSGYMETGQARLSSTQGQRKILYYPTREAAIDALSKTGDPMVTNELLADLMSGKNYVRKMEAERPAKSTYYNEITVTITPSFTQEPNVK